MYFLMNIILTYIHTGFFLFKYESLGAYMKILWVHTFRIQLFVFEPVPSFISSRGHYLLKYGLLETLHKMQP